MAFDPYHKLLSIPPKEQPPDYYRLLSIRQFEDDLEVIEAAADRQMTHVRKYAHGNHADHSQQLLNELSAARLCLLDPSKKTEYDEALRATLKPKAPHVAPPPPAPTAQLFEEQTEEDWTAPLASAASFIEPAARKTSRSPLVFVIPFFIAMAVVLTISIAAVVFRSSQQRSTEVAGRRKTAKPEVNPNATQTESTARFETEFTNSIEMKFKLIPHDTPFYIGVYEVTQEQYQQVMGANPSKFKGPQNPVEQVSWNDAVEFCRRLSEKDKRTYRLPTEAEWEFACRAGTTTEYSFGDDGGELGKYAWFIKNSNRSTHPVGQKLPNPWGLFDMHGNVREWCQDAKGSWPFCRGGSWFSSPKECRSRILRVPFRPHAYWLGFRLATVPPSRVPEAK